MSLEPIASFSLLSDKSCELGLGQQLDNIVAESVDTPSLHFWHSLGFRFSQGSGEEDHWDEPEALNAQLDYVVHFCETEVRPDVSSCVTEQAFRVTGSFHEMSCTMRDYWR